MRIPGSLSLSLSLSLLHWRREREERLGGVRPWSGPTTPAYPIGPTPTFTLRLGLPPPLHHIGRTCTLLTSARCPRAGGTQLMSIRYTSAQYDVMPTARHVIPGMLGAPGHRQDGTCWRDWVQCCWAPAIACAVLKQPKIPFIFSGPIRTFGGSSAVTEVAGNAHAF
jgi:hypothetical protein